MSTHALTVEGIGKVELTVTERGDGSPMLLLHGGAGPQSVVGFADLLARTRPALVLTPVHPGFGGTPRPESLIDVPGLAHTYAALLGEMQLTNVTVVGNSIGGWIAAELALLDTGRVGRLILVDAVGIEVPGHPVADIFSMSFDELTRISYHNPDRFRINLAALPPEARAAAAANRATLAVYGGKPTKVDPTLRGRLNKVKVPTLVVWGESDRVVDPDYGRAFAAAIPNARFELLPQTGHVPQIETPERLLKAILDFAAAPE
jgi:pimeloyl-ACP methyl ester carboxylesterase